MSMSRRKFIKSAAIAGAGVSVPVSVIAAGKQPEFDMGQLIHLRAKFDALYDICEKAIVVMDCLPHSMHMIQVGTGQISEANSIIESLMQRPDNRLDWSGYSVSTSHGLSWGHVSARCGPRNTRTVVTIFEKYDDYHRLIKESQFFRDIGLR